MTACLKSYNPVLIRWWVDTEGTKYFDITAVKKAIFVKLPFASKI
jgi:hypothetical protein